MGLTAQKSAFHLHLCEPESVDKFSSWNKPLVKAGGVIGEYEKIHVDYVLSQTLIISEVTTNAEFYFIFYQQACMVEMVKFNEVHL